MAPAPQYNQGQSGHDLLPDWELQQAREWEDSEHPGCDTAEILEADGTTEEALVTEAERTQQALEGDVARLIGEDMVPMTREEYAALQEA